MLFKKTPTSTEKPEVTEKKSSWFKRLVNYTRSDKDYVPVVKITRNPEKKKKRSLWRQIKSILIITITFYVMLCAFVLLNPQYALFFNNVLGIQYLIIRTILEYTIYIVYGIFGIILGAGFLFFGFRALAIHTTSRLKHTNIWLLTVFFCVLFFSNIALFAWTYDWFRKIDFGNLEGRILVYDNTILKYLKPDDDISYALISSDALIGPLSVRYDISAYVTRIARLEGLLLTQPYDFEIDYNDDKRPDRGSGRTNYVDRPISDVDYAPMIAPEFLYDQARDYKPTATIRGTDVGGNPISLTLDFPAVSLQKIVGINRTMLSNGGIQYAFDASSLSDLGQVQWTVVGESIVHTGYQFSPNEIFQTPTIICLQVFRGEKPVSNKCDWRFVTEESTKSNIQDTNISVKVDTLNPLKYQFEVNPTTLQGEIHTVRWYINNNLYVGSFSSGFERIFDYTFHDPGTYKVEAEIEDTLGNIVRVATSDPVYTASLVDLKDGYTLQISDEDGADYDYDNYDRQTKSYLLPDFPVPGILALNATGVRATSSRLRLEKVEWDSDADGVYESEGYTFDYDMQVPGRYDIRVRYTFTDLSIDGNDVPIYHIDRIAVVGVQKPIDVRVKITPDDNYAPANVRFDASGSKVQKGDIRKFIYDFGDGNKHEGEGVVTTYRYNTPGEYTITVTAVTNTGEQSSKKYLLILKKPQETVRIQPSIASGLAQYGLPVTFEAAIGGTDNTITWNMGDGSGQKTGKTIVHEFRTSGTYTISVKVQYTSGIQESDTITYIVN